MCAVATRKDAMRQLPSPTNSVGLVTQAPNIRAPSSSLNSLHAQLMLYTHAAGGAGASAYSCKRRSTAARSADSKRALISLNTTNKHALFASRARLHR